METSGALTKLLKEGILIDEDDPVLEAQSQIQMRENEQGHFVETLGN